MSMWKYVVVLCVVTACSGRPQTDPDECDGIYCEESDDLTQTYYDGEEGNDSNGSNGTSSLARQALYYRSRPSRQVVM